MARTRWRRALVVAALVGGGVVGVAVIGVGGAVWWLRTPSGNVWLTEQLVEQVRSRQAEGGFEVGAIHTDVFGRAVVRDVALTDGQGKVLLGADRLVLRYDLLPLLGREVQLDYLEADGLVVDLHADERGLLDLQRVFGQTEPAPDTSDPWAGLPVGLDIDELRAYGARFRYTADAAGGGDPTVVSAVGLNLAAGVHGEGTRVDVQDIALSGVLTAPYVAPVVARGGVVYTGDAVSFDDVTLWLPESKLGVQGSISELDTAARFDLAVDADPFDLDLIERLTTGDQDFRGRLAGQVAITGTPDALRFQGPLAGVHGTPGQIGVDLTLDTTATGLPFRGALDLDGVQVDSLYATPGNELELNGRLEASGQLGGWPETFRVEGRYEGGRTVLTRPEQGQVLEFDRLSGDLRIERGVLEFEGVEARGPIGDLSASGSLDLVSGELSTNVGGEIVLDVLERLGVRDLGGGGSIDARVTGNVFADDLPLAATGTVVLEPFVYRGGDVRFERLEARFDWWMRGPVQHVSTGVVAEQGDVYGVQVATVRAPDVVIELPPSGEVLIAGTAQVEEVVSGETFSLSVADLAYDVRVPADDSGTAARVGVNLGPHVLMGEFPGSEGTAELALSGDSLAYDVDLFANGRPFVVATGTYGLESQQVLLDELVASPTPRQRWVGEGTQRFVVTDGGVRDADIVIASDLGRIEVQGTIGAEGPLDGGILTEDLSLDVFAELFPEALSGLSGLLDLQLGLEGRADDPRISADLDAEALWVPGFSRWLDVRGRVDGTRTRLDVDLGIGAAGEELALLQGFIPVDLDFADPRLDVDGAVDIEAVLRPGSLARLEWLSEEQLGLPEGRISAVLEAKGQLRDPDFHLTGVVEADVEGWDDRGRVEFDVDRSADTLAWWADLREGYALRGDVAGQGRTRIGEAIAWVLAEEGEVPEPNWDDWTLYIDDIDARVAALGTPVRSLLALADSPVDATGELLGGFLITGSPSRPVVSGGLNWVGGSLGGVPVPGGYLALVPGEEAYRLDVALEFENEGSFVASGDVPIALDLREDAEQWATGDLDLTFDGLVPLQILAAFDEGIGETRGSVALRGRVGGSPLDPQPEAVLSLVDGAITYAPLGVIYEDIDLDLTFDARRVTLTNLSMRSEPIQQLFKGVGEAFGVRLPQGSRFRAAGSARLEDWTPRGVSVRMSAKQFDFSALADQALVASAEITAGGDWPALEIRGGVTVDRGLFVYDSAEFDGGAPLTLNDALVVHRPGVAPSIRPEVDEEPPVWASFDMRIALDLNRAMEVRAELPFVEDYGTLGALVSTANLTARLGSRDLLVTLREGELAVLNEVEIVEGQAAVFRALFDIGGGTLTFLGEPDNPLLDVQGTMRLSTGTVEMSITGPANDPDIAFASETYPDQTEIFTILLTGGTPEEWSGGGAGGDVGSLFFGVLTDTFLGEAASKSFTVDPDGTLRISIPVSRGVRAEWRFDPLANQQTENVTTVAVDVSLFRQISLEAAFGDERSWADVYWEYRF